MKQNKMGLWIDCQRAVLVSRDEQKFGISVIDSDLDKEQWQISVWRLPEQIGKKMLGDQLARFYETVSKCLITAKLIVILGPGNATGGLRTQLGVDNYRGRIMTIESTPMTQEDLVSNIAIAFTESEISLTEPTEKNNRPECAATHGQPLFFTA